MLKENPQDKGQDELFRSRLDQIIDMRHPLVKMSQLIEWDALEAAFKNHYCSSNGRPGGSIRLMAGLLLLKEIKGISDETVCQEWSENPYFQYFCGETFFQHRFPVEPPSLSYFRKRIGQEGFERLLQETITLGLKTGTVSPKDVARVNVDTTVQEKAIKFPTDTQLCHTAREKLVELVEEQGYRLRQNYRRKSKEDLLQANRYFAARQMKRARKVAKSVRNYLGRVMRETERLAANDPQLAASVTEALEKSRIIHRQAGDRKCKEKLYSFHAPEVECIAKGKANKAYEFGVKVSVATTQARNFIVGALASHKKPYDGHTLKPALEQVLRLTGIVPKEAYVDLGYRGHGVEESSGTTVILPRQKRGLTKAMHKRKRRRHAIEPVIGHCKHDRAVGPRNFLKGIVGDQMNALAMAIGFNLRKILRKIFLCLFYRWVLMVITQPKTYRASYQVA
jgi:IS5 family transposase